MISEIIHSIRREIAERNGARERARIARAFNDRYTYLHRYVKGQPALPGDAMYGMTPPGGNAWMCPDCNRIHLANGCSALSGLQFPGCCKTPSGHRIFSGIKTP